MIELGNSLPLSPFTIRKAKKANWFWKTLDYCLDWIEKIGLKAENFLLYHKMLNLRVDKVWTVVCRLIGWRLKVSREGKVRIISAFYFHWTSVFINTRIKNIIYLSIFKPQSTSCTTKKLKIDVMPTYGHDFYHQNWITCLLMLYLIFWSLKSD